MAEKIIKARIKLNKQSEEELASSNPILKEGEVVLSTISNLDDTDTVLMKIGNGIQPYDELPWLSSLAADVFDWAKAETKPEYNYSEIKNKPDTFTPSAHKHSSTEINETEEKQFISAADKQKLDNIFLQVYPVGSIYINTVNTNPSTFFGGVWQAFGTGRTIFGVDTAQTEFNTVEKTGGAKKSSVSIPTLSKSSYIALESGTEQFANSGQVSVDTIPPYITVYMWKRIS